MATYKEIVTKAVIGKGKKTTENTYTMTTENKPNTVLGCWVINHRFKGNKSGNNVTVNGSFDVNVWYSYDDDSKTAVSTKQFDYVENLNVRLKEQNGYNSENEIIVESLKQPTVSDVKLENNNVVLQIEKELGVQVIGDAKMKIAIEDDEEPWDDIQDEEVVSSQIDDINTDYLK